MDKTSRVSVIISVTGINDNLTRCLGSVTTQTMYDIEVICVAASEAVALALAPYKTREPRMVVTTAGSDDPRNFGLTMATGEYVHFMDPGIQLDPWAYTHWWHEASTQKADVSQCLYGQPATQFSNFIDTDHDGLYLVLNGSTLWDKLFRREWLLDHNLLFDEKLPASTSAFSYQAILAAKRLLVLDGRWLIGDATPPVLDKAGARRLANECGPALEKQLIAAMRHTSEPGPARKLRHRLGAVRRDAVSRWFKRQESRGKETSAKSAAGKPVIWMNEPKMVVAMTTTPERLPQTREAANRLAGQTLPPDEVAVWVSGEAPAADPCDGLVIRQLEDAQPGAWLAAMLRQYPGAVIVTAGDDRTYSEDWLQTLHDSFMYETAPLIHCLGMTRALCPDGGWHLVPACYSQPTYLNLPDIAAGVLIPPVAVDPSAIAAANGRQPADDGTWLWLMAVLGKAKIKSIAPVANEQRVGQPIDFDTFTGTTGLEQSMEADYELMRQVDELGRIPQSRKTEAYNKALDPALYPAELMLWYERLTGMHVNLDNPKTLNEKIQWQKLYGTTPVMSRLSDKYLVRDWVAEMIGSQYLIPLIGVWDSFDDIDFKAMPDRFVLKANHGSHWNILVYDKKEFNIPYARRQMNNWLASNFGYRPGLELQYAPIKPKVIAEQMIAGKEIQDLRFWCFDGEVKSIWLDSDRASELQRLIFDADWNLQPFKVRVSASENVPQRPPELETLIKLAQVLSQGFAQVRVDFYVVNHKIYFGEMTFTSSGGRAHTSPAEYAYQMGAWINLPASVSGS